jgi:hypothetical protein
MGAWLLQAFTGETPRIARNLLAPNAAQSAVNVRLDNGEIRPLREPEHIYSFPSYVDNFKTIYRHLDTWLGWNTDVYAVPGPVASDRLYIMGDGAPKMRVDSTVYPLKVPFPATGLTAVVSGTATDPSSPITTRVYVYTYVTAYGEESEPCPASAGVAWQAGQSVNVSGFAAAPAGRNITKQRIYRTQTGSGGTDLYFIKERAASALDFADTIAEEAFGEIIPSRAYNAPPDTLTGLIAMPNGMMAAFSGRDLYFSKPFQPHAWPEVYVLTTDFDIVALGAVGTSLVIMTKGNPYLASGTDPASMQMVKLETNLPCINARGVKDLGYAIAYPSHEGLVLAGGDGQAKVVTDTLFNRTDWQRFNPGTICSGQLSGIYLASYNSVEADGSPLVGTLLLQSATAPVFLTRSDVRARAFFYDITEGALYYLTSAGDVMRFDPPSGVPLNAYWKSKPLLLPSAENFGVIQIDGDRTPTPAEVINIQGARDAAEVANTTLMLSPLGAELNGCYVNQFTMAGDGLVPLPPIAKEITVKVYADGVAVGAASLTGAPLRLPSGFRARKWEIDVFGTITVSRIAMANTMEDLKTMAAA